MQSVWIEICHNLNLSKAEKVALDRYDKDRRSFLPVADILRNHDRLDECIELLYEGVNAYPNFSVARVILARDLFLKKMLVESYSLLEESPVSLKDNILATKLKFKLSLALSREQICIRILKRLEAEQLHDAETKSLAASLSQGTFQAASDKYRKSLGIDKVPDFLIEPTEQTPDPSSDFPLNPKSKSTDRSRQKVGVFQVLPLREIFQGATQMSKPSSGIELDTSTLGELYFKQGYYKKAAEVYERLIKSTPKNETLRAKLLEARSKLREQREERFSMPADIADQIETHEIIDIQREFFTNLLDKINHLDQR